MNVPGTDTPFHQLAAHLQETTQRDTNKKQQCYSFVTNIKKKTKKRVYILLVVSAVLCTLFILRNLGVAFHTHFTSG